MKIYRLNSIRRMEKSVLKGKERLCIFESCLLLQKISFSSFELQNLFFVHRCDRGVEEIMDKNFFDRNHW